MVVFHDQSYFFPSHRTIYVEPCVSRLGSQDVSSWTCSSRVPACVLSWNRGWSQRGATVLQKCRRGTQTSQCSTNITADSKKPTEDTMCKHPDCTMCASNRHYCNAEWPESHLKVWREIKNNKTNNWFHVCASFSRNYSSPGLVLAYSLVHIASYCWKQQ